MVAKTKPCILCGQQLEPALDDWKTFQPYGGGEVQFVFGYGSRRFDESAGSTVFRGIICDSCAAKYVDQMERTD
jgi:hypothetical protein